MTKSLAAARGRSCNTVRSFWHHTITSSQGHITRIHTDTFTNLLWAQLNSETTLVLPSV